MRGVVFLQYFILHSVEWIFRCVFHVPVLCCAVYALCGWYFFSIIVTLTMCNSARVRYIFFSLYPFVPLLNLFTTLLIRRNSSRSWYLRFKKLKIKIERVLCYRHSNFEAVPGWSGQHKRSIPFHLIIVIILWIHSTLSFRNSFDSARSACLALELHF